MLFSGLVTTLVFYTERLLFSFSALWEGYRRGARGHGHFVVSLRRLEDRFWRELFFDRHNLGACHFAPGFVFLNKQNERDYCFSGRQPYYLS